ncbi:MAG TPA: nucleoside triphosphate pyrophosphatase [Terrimicrobiaceae bacterium]
MPVYSGDNSVQLGRSEAILLLASASARRRELLLSAGVDFQVETAAIEELVAGELTARELCRMNAELKAFEVASRFPSSIVLGADTVVSLEGRIFGKPVTFSEAREMLEALCGNVHEVLTGVCLVQRNEGKLCRFVEVTRVKFRPRWEVDLEKYLESIHPLDKAGGYAAQEDYGRLIECVEGSMSNVIGLPVERVLAALHRHFLQV